jgi:hypothetical protein
MAEQLVEKKTGRRRMPFLREAQQNWHKVCLSPISPRPFFRVTIRQQGGTEDHPINGGKMKGQRHGGIGQKQTFFCGRICWGK